MAKPKKEVRRYVLSLKLTAEVIAALKAKAALERTTVAQLVTDWVQSWEKRQRSR